MEPNRTDHQVQELHSVALNPFKPVSGYLQIISVLRDTEEREFGLKEMFDFELNQMKWQK